MDQNPTDHVIGFATQTRWQDLPEAVRHQSRRCLLDALGALIAGMETPVGGIMAEMALEQYPGNQATILVKHRKASLVGATLANGFAGNALDIDDGYRMTKGHPGACTLPVVLAAGEAAGCSGEEFLTALVIGYEIGIRAGLIRHATSATYHSSGSWGAVAGAAAGGRLMGLSPETLRHAMGSAEYHAPIAPMMKGIDTPSMGKDSIGWGCMVAVNAILMARKGFTGIRPLFDDTPEPAWIESLGRSYEMMNLYFKPYAACRWAQPPVEGVLAIMRNERLAVDDIRKIWVATFAEAAALIQTAPKNTEDAQYNMCFPIAAAAIDGEVGPRQVLPPRLFDRDIRRMMDRIEVTVEDRFQREFPAKALAEVTVEATDGRRFASGTLSARWDPSSTLPSDGDLEEKFLWLTGPVIGQMKARRLAEDIWSADRWTSIDPIFDGCRAAVA
jgi:2-methylcitrate dehydratase PrpD